MTWVLPLLLKIAMFPPVPTVANIELATVCPLAKFTEDVPGRLLP